MQEALRKPESYGEKKLTELLDYATSTLSPGPGYSLEVQGTKVPKLTIKEMGAFFGVSLDESAGADMNLVYDTSGSTFQLQKLTFKVEGGSGTASIIRTESIGLIPMIEMGQQVFRSRASYLSYEDGDNILKNIGADIKPPLTSPDEYATWRQGILAATHGWHLTEKVEIPTDIKSDYMSVTTISHEETLGLSSRGAVTTHIDTRRVASSTILFDDATNKTSRLSSVIESVADNDRPHLHIYNELSSHQHDPFIINKSDDTSFQIEPVELNRDTFTRYRSIVDEAIDLQLKS